MSGEIDEFAGVAAFVVEGDVEGFEIELADEVPGDVGSAVDEFRTEFDGGFELGVVEGVDSAADAVAGFEDEDVAIVVGENFSGGEAGGGRLRGLGSKRGSFVLGGA